MLDVCVQGLTGLVPVGGSMQTFQGQIIHQSGGNAYLIHSGTMDGDGSSLSHTTRASPATVSHVSLACVLLIC